MVQGRTRVEGQSTRGVQMDGRAGNPGSTLVGNGIDRVALWPAAQAAYVDASDGHLPIPTTPQQPESGVGYQRFGPRIPSGL